MVKYLDPSFAGTNVISITGGYDSTPRGGIITFSGSAELFGGNSVSYGSNFPISGLGNFRVTSSSTKTTAEGSRTTISLVCILGFLRFKGITNGLGSCRRWDSGENTAQGVVNDLCNIIGIPAFPLPFADQQPILEPVWIKEGENALDLLQEVLVAYGAVLYSPDGSSIVCEPLEAFVSGLRGSESENTINATNLNFGSRPPSAMIITGNKQVLFNLPTNETMSTSNNQIVTTTTTIQRGGQYTNRTIRTETDVRANNTGSSGTLFDTRGAYWLNTRTVVEEVYEDRSNNPGSNIPLNVADCYPEDPGRILRRETKVYAHPDSVISVALAEFLASVRRDSLTNFFVSISGELLVERTIETWDYKTINTQVVFGDPGTGTSSGIPAETVEYNRTKRERLARIDSFFGNATLGSNFPFLADEEQTDIFVDAMVGAVLNSAWNDFIISEEEVINWQKDRGDYRWTGDRKVYINAYRKSPGYFQRRIARRARRQIEAGLDATQSRTEATSLVISIRDGMKNLVEDLSETRQDWSPDTSTVYPSPVRIEDTPYIDRIPLSGDGGIVSINAGRFATYNVAKRAGEGILALEQARTSTLTVTNINQIFRVGEIDAPSFSISEEGTTTSGSYLLG